MKRQRLLLFCLLLGAAGCRSAEEDAKQARMSAASWCATLRETAIDLAARRVPSRFAKDTFRRGRQELTDGLSEIRKLASRSTLAADAARRVAEAADIAAALESHPSAELEARTERLEVLAAELSRGSAP